MRRVALAVVFCTLLAVPFVVTRPAPAAPDDQGPQAALAESERMEQRAREMIEAGRRAEGAKLMSEAWRLRAKAWAAQDGKRADAGATDLAALEEKARALAAEVEELRAASNDAERRAKDAQETGREDEAKGWIEKSGALWKESEAQAKRLAEVQAKIERTRAGGGKEGGGKEGGAKEGSGGPGGDVERRIAELKELSAAEERAAHEAKAAGRPDEAETHVARAREAWEEAKRLAGKAEKPRPAPGQGGERGEGGDKLARTVEDLRRQNAELRAQLEELRAELEALKAQLASK